MEIILTALLAAASVAQSLEASKYFRINVVDDQTHRGVPLVELRTVNGISHFTDGNGIVAFLEPGLMGRDVYFFVSSHGYEFPKDGFGFRGKTLPVKAGASATLKIKRINIAERIARLTGGGIYRDSVLVGERPPIQEPLLNGQVFGCDSVMNVRYRDKIFWFWGDTNKPSYPLGNFQVPGATTDIVLADATRTKPAIEYGLNYEYFLNDKGFVKETMRMPGKGPTWMTALVPISDGRGFDSLYASYVKVEPPLKIYARGLAKWDDKAEEFKHVVDVDMKHPAFPMGHAIGVFDHMYFGNPFLVTRVWNSQKDFLNPKAYECYTCLKDGSRLDDPQFDRDAKGKLIYKWRKNAPAIGAKEEAEWLKAGKLKPDDVRWQLRDRDTGKLVMPHHGSCFFNFDTNRFRLIVSEIGGTSLLGETWYAEADTPTGPWKYAVKIVTHDKYSFYNPKEHPMYSDRRYVYFEGTYTHTFSGNSQPTPRYDYNQILYKLDMEDTRLATPVAVYQIPTGKAPIGFARYERDQKERPVAFYVLDRQLPKTVPLNIGIVRGNNPKLRFFALPPDAKNEGTTPLYEYRADEGRHAYSTDGELKLEGYVRQEKPLCRVWK